MGLFFLLLFVKLVDCFPNHGRVGVLKSFQNFPGNHFKGLSDVTGIHGRNLSEGELVGLGELIAFVIGDLSFLHLIAFVSHYKFVDIFTGVPE